MAKAIVVLPFDNRSPEKKDEALVEGLTDEIRELLGKQRAVRVISRMSSVAFKHRNVSVGEIAQQLSVSHVLDGSVERDGDLFRIAAELIDVTTDSQVWHEAYEAKLDRFFTIQDRIGAAIANALDIEFAFAAGPHARTSDAQAYRLFLEAVARFRSREKGSIDDAINMFKRAIERDANYAEAHAGLASTYFSKASRLNVGYQKYWDLAEASALKARTLKPELGQAHAVLGALARGRFKWEEAFASGQKAVELDPSDSNARLWLGLTQFFAGQLDDAKRTLEEAQKSDPLYTFIRLWRARVAFARGDDKEGVELSDKLIESGADYRGFGYWYLAYLAQRRNAADEAEKNYRSAVAVWKTGESIADRLVKALHGAEPAAETVAALKAEAERDPDFAPELEYLLIGQEAALMEALKARLARGDSDGFNYFLSFLWRKPSAGSDAFRELVRDAGLVAYWRKHGWPDKCRATAGDDFICD
jgi:TolB-like protein/Tfp pilus assembly protein PilF